MPDYDCLLEPHLKLKLATPVAGVLKNVMVDRGDRITKDMKVAGLESALEEANAELAAARADNDASVSGRQARVAFLKRKFDRVVQLFLKGASSDSQRDEADTDHRFAAEELREAEFNLKIAKLEYARALVQLNQRSIYSPISGVVTERHLGPGEYAYEQAPIFTVAQIDPLNVEVYVPVALFPKVALGQTATVTIEPPMSGSHQARITVIDPVFDARSGTVGIRLELPNPDGRIPAGLRCRVKLNTAAR